MNRLPCSWKAMTYEPESTVTWTRIYLFTYGECFPLGRTRWAMDI